MRTATWKIRITSLLVPGLLMLAGILSNAPLVVAQSQEACPLPAGGTPVEVPRVTAQQVENGTGSLMDFALGARDRFREHARRATTGGRSLYLACLIRQDESPWRSGSTYLVTLTPDGRVFVHAKDMSLSGRKLKKSIYGGILRALGINLADLANPDAVRTAFTAALAGNGGSFAIPNVPGVSGYATVTTSLGFRTPIVLLAGFDLNETHLAEEQIDYGDPAVTAADVVDQATLKAFVTEAGNYFIEFLKTGDPAAVAKATIAMRDPDGPWRHGSVYLYILNLSNDIILVHAAFPDRFEFRPLVPTVRDVVTGELILPQVIAAAKSNPEGGFVEYYFDDPTDDTDSADNAERPEGGRTVVDALDNTSAERALLFAGHDVHHWRGPYPGEVGRLMFCRYTAFDQARTHTEAEIDRLADAGLAELDGRPADVPRDLIQARCTSQDLARAGRTHVTVPGLFTAEECTQAGAAGTWPDWIARRLRRAVSEAAPVLIPGCAFAGHEIRLAGPLMLSAAGIPREPERGHRVHAAVCLETGEAEVRRADAPARRRGGGRAIWAAYGEPPDFIERTARLRTRAARE